MGFLRTRDLLVKTTMDLRWLRRLRERTGSRRRVRLRQLKAFKRGLVAEASGAGRPRVPVEKACLVARRARAGQSRPPRGGRGKSEVWTLCPGRILQTWEFDKRQRLGR